MANRLIHETSPYLLQHAHNPVDWYPWGEEALALARRQNKPVLVSIGYAACHWCHVMEHESFEDVETAALMNEYFINIKVDREERPDVDHLYMDALQAMTGGGGWPLNVFLLPDGRPFYGGTYYPPVRAFNRSSWKEVITAIHKSYNEKKNELELQADNLTQHLVQANSFGKAAGEGDLFTKENLELITANILKQSDTEWGGFGKAPKFPQSFTINYLLSYYFHTKDNDALQQALLSLDKMSAGGLYDRVGGGFARYSTDAAWLAPHFEKMLYDNALLLSTYADAYKLTKNERYKEVIEETIAFIKRELMHESGAFYSALDADSEGIEGKFYTWTKEEIDILLGDDSTVFCTVFNISAQGNWHDAPKQIAEWNILWQTEPWVVLSTEMGISTDELQGLIRGCLQKLLVQRNKRVRPLLDDKILVNWNALMVAALCKCAQALEDNAYVDMAQKTIQFIEEQCFTENFLLHSYKLNNKIEGFLDDYAYLIKAYINLQEVTGDTKYLMKANILCEAVVKLFGDEQDCYFYFTQKASKNIVVRKKEIYDGATPSGNVVMCENFLYLAAIFQRSDWMERAVLMISSLGKTIIRYPASFGIWASILQKLTYGIKEVVAIGINAATIVEKLEKNFLPAHILQWSAIKNDDFVLLQNRYTIDNTFIYICENNTCKQPFTNLSTALSEIIGHSS